MKRSLLSQFVIGLALYFLCAAPAVATPPSAYPALTIAGIGFSYYPKFREMGCVRSACKLTQLENGVMVTISYPADLIDFGSECPSTTGASGFKFRIGRIVADRPDASIHIQLESITCKGRVMAFDFRPVKWSNSRSVAATIASSLQELMVCVLSKPRTLTCNDLPLIDADDSDRIWKSTLAWAERHKRALR
jgi:hypothetical protein